MKSRVLIVFFVLILCFHAGFALASPDSDFPENVIEVPAGTEVSIDDDNGLVTLRNASVTIEPGDTFVVYLQDLPVGYVAREVTEAGEDLVIAAEKADKSVYSQLRESGTVALTGEMYDFIPARNASSIRGTSYEILDVLKYEDGELTVNVRIPSGLTVRVTFSGMYLNHSFSGGDIKVSLGGNWKIMTGVSTGEVNLAEIPLGEIRVYGIGKIALSLNLTLEDASIGLTLSGTFSAGIDAEEGGSGNLTRSFTLDHVNVEGEGLFTLALKLTAGVDVLVAEADLYAEIGAETYFQHQSTVPEGQNTPVSCDNYKTFVFLTVGAEAQYLSASGQMERLASLDFNLIDENNTPFLVNRHFENGYETLVCSQGMDITNIDRLYDGMTSDFGSDLFSGNRDRTLETEVAIPWDVQVTGNYTIGQEGVLFSDGHTLTVDGDLIVFGDLEINGGKMIVTGNLYLNDGSILLGEGELEIGGNFIQGAGLFSSYYGTVSVAGDYRIQSLSDGHYGDSTGTVCLYYPECSLWIGGDFVLQTNSEAHRPYAGTFTINGNMRQYNPSSGICCFMPSCRFIFTESQPHQISFEDPVHNWISGLDLRNDLTAQNDIRIGGRPAGVNGHSFLIQGSLTLDDSVHLGGGTVTVNGNLHHRAYGIYFEEGKLSVSGSYWSTGPDSDCGNSLFTPGGGAVYMTSPQDEFRVGGDYIVASDNSSGDMTDGTIFIGGDFRLVSEGDGIGHHANFAPEDNHTVVFNGSRLQTIEFDSPYSSFAHVRFPNGNIRLTGHALGRLILEDDINLVLDTDSLTLNPQYGNIDLNGHDIGLRVIDSDFALYHGSVELGGTELTVTGNLTLDCDLTLNGSDIRVNGSLYHLGGTIFFEGGKLSVSGSYLSAGAGSDYGNNLFTPGGGAVYMTYPQDEFRVGGDYIVASDNSSGVMTDGTIFIGGDFRQVSEGDGIGSPANYAPEDNHMVVLNGRGAQTVQFDSYGSSRFAALKITKPLEMYEFIPNPCWQTLIQEELTVFGDPDYILPDDLTVIEEYAFESTPVSVVYIPDNCTNIGAWAFIHCENLTQIRIPAGCLIHDEAFAECPQTLYIFGYPDSPAETFCAMHANRVFVGIDR